MLKDKTPTLKLAYVSTISVFVLFAAWWLFNKIQFTSEDTANALFSDTHWLMALIGGTAGLWAAKKWGGIKSVFGRSIFLFSAGLLAQVFGQVVYTFYARVQHVEAPYPSIGDVGFFGSVILYIFAIYLLAKTAGASLSRINASKKVIAVLLPALLLVGSYVVFLKDYEADWSAPLVVLLDFGYPLSQAIYVSLALLTYFLSRGLLGGVMKKKIILLLAALVIQYAADYSFLFRFNRETWYPGDISDLLYLTAYFLMGIALLQFASVATALNKERPGSGDGNVGQAEQPSNSQEVTT